MPEDEPWKPESEDQEGEGEEEVDETQYKHPKDAVLFVIDVSKSMLTPPPPDAKGKVGESPLSAALEVAYELMTQRIISDPNDKMGIMLYGTAATKTADGNTSSGISDSEAHFCLLVDLDVPSAQEVKTIKNLVEDTDDFEKLMVPAKKPVSMADVFFNAQTIFTTRAANFVSKRLFLVTDNDDPYRGPKKDQPQQMASDLNDIEVVIELFPVPKPGNVFDRSKFYDDIITAKKPADPNAPAPLSRPTEVSQKDGISLLSALLHSVLSRTAPKRAQSRNIPMEIGPNFKISVNRYIIFQRQGKQRTAWVWLADEKAHLVKPVTMKATEIKGEGKGEHQGEGKSVAVGKAQIRKAYKFGGTQIAFTEEEMKGIRNFGDPVIRILGFKPYNRDTLPIWANTGKATLIYPSEEDYVGSTRVFSALLQKMKRDNKIALAWFIARKNAVPALVAILPGEQRLNGDGDMVVPDGMWLIPLPYADDIRQNPESMVIPAPDPLIDRMKDIMEQLQLPGAQYVPERYPNPDLQNHYRVLQMLALEEEFDDDAARDKTLPSYKGIHKRANEFIQEWGQELEQQHRLWEKENRHETTLAKRPASSAADDAPKKKAKASGGDQIVGDDEMKGRFEAGTISKLTVAVLKTFLSEKGLSTSGAKAALVERVEEFFETKA